MGLFSTDIERTDILGPTLDQLGPRSSWPVDLAPSLDRIVAAVDDLKQAAVNGYLLPDAKIEEVRTWLGGIAAAVESTIYQWQTGDLSAKSAASSELAAWADEAERRRAQWVQSDSAAQAGSEYSPSPPGSPRGKGGNAWAGDLLDKIGRVGTIVAVTAIIGGIVIVAIRR